MTSGATSNMCVWVGTKWTGVLQHIGICCAFPGMKEYFLLIYMLQGLVDIVYKYCGNK